MPRLDLPLGEVSDLWEAQQKAEQLGCIVGCDEAGRGPLAGPVVCAAVHLPRGFVLEGLRDSKKMSEAKRELLFPQIIEQVEHYSIQVISPLEIDKTDILAASLEGMKRAVLALNLESPIPVVDGSQLLRQWTGVQYSLVKGDDRLAAIAAASVLAKVTRDRIMIQAERDYPGYGFAKHKGYPTVEHLELLKKLGPCPIHRMSFKPLSQMDLFAEF